jgi:hypothetical protein
VTPREVLRRRLFSAPAIALALALFGVSEVALTEVRARISPWATVGATAAAGWVSLRRWVADVRAGRLRGAGGAGDVDGEAGGGARGDDARRARPRPGGHGQRPG